MPFPALRSGAGRFGTQSASADEYIYLEEIRGGIEGYIAFVLAPVLAAGA